MEDNVVYLAVLQKVLSAVSAVKTTDYTPSVTIATTSYYGTGIYVFRIPFRQHFSILER